MVEAVRDMGNIPAPYCAIVGRLGNVRLDGWLMVGERGELGTVSDRQKHTIAHDVNIQLLFPSHYMPSTTLLSCPLLVPHTFVNE